ncbi:pentapeptide repeat-containing protein [Streptomyces sp. NPDC001102]
MESYLSTLHPGSDIEHRGTLVSGQTLRKILTCITDPENERPTFGTARFDSATFPTYANFERSHFRGLAVFEAAHFKRSADFSRANFDRNADFRQSRFKLKATFMGCTFDRTARFEGVSFAGVAAMNEATFKGVAQFDRAGFERRSFFTQARFSREAYFRQAKFNQDAEFSNVNFERVAQFNRAEFIGSAWFGKCRFEGAATFTSTTFNGLLRMEHCFFNGPAQFDRAKIHGNAEFECAKFKSAARFKGAQFSGQAQFRKVTFDGTASFRFAAFTGVATFSGSSFSGTVSLDSTKFDSGAKFAETSFTAATYLGPIVCLGTLHWSGADFSKPITIELAAPRVRFRRARFGSAATIKARYAAIDLTDTALSSPVVVTAHPVPFTTNASGSKIEVDESRLNEQGISAVASLTSVRGVDVSHLVLTDVSLTDCEFSGAVQLDKIHLQGDYRFPEAPTRWNRVLGVPLIRPTRRVTLAEEQHWRASRSSLSSNGWKSRKNTASGDFTAKPRNLAATYRELRKSLEDSKNEPDAADFYYGEMEMRRHDNARPTAERILLTLYWVVSGYGLRAIRAFAALLIALCLASSSIMLLGLPSNDQSPRTTVGLNHGGISIETKTPPPSLKASFPERVSWHRFEEATQANLNAVFFRRSDTSLTTLGVYIQMVARLLIPTLFVLGVLAIRNRVKR